LTGTNPANTTKEKGETTTRDYEEKILGGKEEGYQNRF